MNDQDRTPEQYILMIERDPLMNLLQKEKKVYHNCSIRF